VVALSVNLNKIALLRNSRPGNYPDVVAHARLVLDAGADGITVHPRPDQRHIRASDCRELAELLRTEHAGIELNIEGNPWAGPRPSQRTDVGDYPGFMALVREVRPAQCTLVPDGDAQLTSDHGFDMRQDGERLAPIIAELNALGIRVSLFLDPDREQIKLAATSGADRIELYTEAYAHAVATQTAVAQVLSQYHEASLQATALGLGVNAGHDLNLVNLPAFATIPGLLEVSIGHALTVDGLQLGLATAVKAYQRALGNIDAA